MKHDETTLDVSDPRPLRLSDPVPCLTVLWHHDPGRVGDRSVLTPFLSASPVALSRGAPRFAPPRGGTARPLDHPRVSRSPLHLRPTSDGGLELDPDESSTVLELDGTPVDGVRRLRRDDLRRGAVLVLGHRVVLLLHLAELDVPPVGDGKLIGESSAIGRLREEIRRAAGLRYPVLLRGETGTGKELVSSAIHHASSRKERPFVTVNVGLFPADQAGSELFGTERGAYTGVDRRDGYFQRAHGGTLFLDEIGATEDKVQVALLRALDTGEVQRVGARKAQTVDVRVIAATDADLEAAIEAGRFRAPLLHRLTSCEIEIPPLRARREDIGRLLLHFLHQELPQGESHRLKPPEDLNDPPWMPASLVARLASWHWPGNVRELQNAVRQLVAANEGRSEVGVPRSLERLLAEKTGEAASPEASVPEEPPPERSAADVDEDELLEALRETGWSVRGASRRLGVPPTSLYRRIDESPRIRKASDLTADEIEESWERCDGDRQRMAEDLAVSPRGLLFRLKELGKA